MERKEFIFLSAKAGAGILIPGFIVQQACTKKQVKEFFYTVITEVASTFIEGCSYSVCIGTVKNHFICNLVSAAMGEATSYIAEKIVGKKEGTHDVGNGRTAKWGIETRKKGLENILKVYYTLSLIDDTVDLLKTLGCPGGNCSGKLINWEYVGVFGVGSYPDTALRLFSSNEIAEMTPYQRCIMRNEMFARHGYRFLHTDTVIEHFNNEEWYVNFPQNLRRYDSDYGDFVLKYYFTDYEKANLNAILQFKDHKC